MAEIKLISIGALIEQENGSPKYKFFIPSYQRGYRWTKQLVYDLLNDINEFKEQHKDENAYYCIQPLVVKRNDDKWDVIDGQQRLTTIFLLLSYLQNEQDTKYSIEYETRKVSEEDKKGSKEFLETVRDATEKDGSQNIDFYHIYNAYQAIVNWFNHFENNDLFRNEFKEILTKNVKFIWYETDEGDPIRVFARLNIGKIALTDSELVKAMFLNRSYFGNNSRIHLLQQEIAAEWDRMEYALQKDEFWLFLNENTKWDKPTRIDYVLNLIATKERDGLGIRDILKEDWENAWSNEGCFGDDEHKIFRYFYKFFSTQSKKSDFRILNVWGKVKSYFQVFEEWYNDIELYHYVGYLVHICPKYENKPIVEYLFDCWAKSSSKKEFIDKLKEIIKNSIELCKDLNKQYEIDGEPKKTTCRPILLLHNVLTILNQNKSLQDSDRYQGYLGTRFPFHLFKKEAYKGGRYGWEVEHIASNAGDCDDNKGILLYLYSAKDYVSDNLRGKIENINREDVKTLNDLRNEVNKELKINWSDEDKNKIWNFTLLDSGTNQQYHNAVFPFKRIFVINKENGIKTEFYIDKENKLVFNEDFKDVAFVPVCTKNVFVKGYTKNPQPLSAWTKEDAADYLRNMEQVLMEYIYPELYKIRVDSRPALNNRIICQIDRAVLNRYIQYITNVKK